MKEWLPSLSSWKKWFRDKADLKVGDVVITTSQEVPRETCWLERIIAVHPAADGTVWVADVKVQGTTLRRPVVKLCPLVRTDDPP